MDLGSLWSVLDDRLVPLLRDYRRGLATLDVARKADRSPVSEADLAAQRVIVESIVDAFPGSGFIAEEDDEPLPRHGDPVWVIDPIDGTGEFVNPSGREYCSVVCRLDGGIPTGAYVLAPELGIGGEPVRIQWADRVTVNGQAAQPMPDRGLPKRASVTRGWGSTPRPYEAELTRIGCDLKVRSTSLILDMVRSAIDLSSWTGAPDRQFDLFYRRNQHLWDAAAGIGLASAMGRLTRDDQGDDPLPMSAELLARDDPALPATICGAPACVRWFSNLLRTERMRGG